MRFVVIAARRARWSARGLATSEALVAAEAEPAVDSIESAAPSRERGARSRYLPGTHRGLHASVVEFANLRKSKAPQDDPLILPATVSNHGRAVIHQHVQQGWIQGLVSCSRGTGSERRLFVWHKESKDPSCGKGNQDSARKRAPTKRTAKKRVERYGWRLSKSEGWSFRPAPQPEMVANARGREREEEVGSIVWYRGGKIVRQSHAKLERQHAAQTTLAAKGSSEAAAQTLTPAPAPAPAQKEDAQAQGSRRPQQQRAAGPALSPLEAELKREVQKLREELARKTEQVGVVKGTLATVERAQCELKRELHATRTAANKARKQAEEAVRLAEFVATLSAVASDPAASDGGETET